MRQKQLLAILKECIGCNIVGIIEGLLNDNYSFSTYSYFKIDFTHENAIDVWDDDYDTFCELVFQQGKLVKIFTVDKEGKKTLFR